MSGLPDDIIIREILPRLPVVSLLRFRCVSKQICNFIDSPFFIKQHMINQSNSMQSISKNKQLIHLIREDSFYWFSSCSCPNQSLRLFHLRKTYDEILGSVNGLLCLSSEYPYFFDPPIIIILNLATKKYHQVPLPHALSLPDDFDNFSTYTGFGFGYDSVSDDFKLLKIRQLSVDYSGTGIQKREAPTAQVYSLRSNSWRMIQDIPDYDFGPGKYGEFVCGALHWMVLLDSIPHAKNEIFALDIVTEKHKLVAKPDIQEVKCSMSAGKLGGCLSLTCNYYRGDRVDLWVMKHYQVKESWSKLFSVSYPKGVSWGWTWALTPLAYSESGDEILLVKEYGHDKELVSYNPDTRTMRKIYGDFGDAFDQAFICGESMVPLSEKVGDLIFSNSEMLVD